MMSFAGCGSALAAIEYATLLCNNYGMLTLRLFGRMLSVGDDGIFTANVADIGHLGSPDPLVNLATVPEDGRALLVFASGPADCALALFCPMERGC